MDEQFDCIIVGGGIAGLSAAMVLAQKGVAFLLIERGEFFGSKNVSGGVLWGSDLHQLVPEYWNEDVSYERFVNHRRLTFVDASSGFSFDYKSDHFAEQPFQGITVLRAKFDAWLASKVEDQISRSPMANRSILATNVLVDDLVTEGDRVVGIRAGDEIFRSRVVILAEGVNNLLTRKAGLEDAYVPADHMAVGVKEIIRLGKGVIEDRFQLNGRSGLANEFVGSFTGGVDGGGFVYTNEDSVSLGLVLGMKDLRERHVTPYDLLDDFKAHAVVRDMIRGGEVIEYSAHTVSSGALAAVPRRLFQDGLLIAGEAAHLLVNSGRGIQGMDFAMRSGMLAAEAVAAAVDAGDFSMTKLSEFQTALENSYVYMNMRTFEDAVNLLHDPMMGETIPAILCDFGRGYFSQSNAPAEKAVSLLRASIKRHASYFDLIKLGVRAAKSL